ncbi:hypothetical protein GCM10022237_26310 [Nocardioides ginsengisoli]|uniref:Peptidase MA-like domain-containing protein n=1 Tax=Nocardioides ginsengisoli TaxID=363868 RepID=A0ABW3W4C5_9ACTN
MRNLAALLLTVGLVAGGCSSGEYVAPPPARVSDAADPVAAAATLVTLQDAVEHGDAAAAGALGADAQGTALLEAVARNAHALGLSDIGFTYLTETGRTDGAHGWDGDVTVTWRVDGFDAASSRVELPISFADGGDRIAAIGAGNGRLPLWLAGPLVVRRAGDALVAVSGDDSEVADRYLPAARRAVAGARAVVGGRTRLMVEVPDSTDLLHRALNAPNGSYAAIAAVTAPVDGSKAPGSPVHVFLNRTVYDGLDKVAAQVVMTHEAVHALTGAPLAQNAPLWLVEGFADYVALRDVALPTSRTAGQIIAQVRRSGAPKALPGPTDFDPTASHLGAVYEAAWQVCVTLAEHGGEQALVRLYRAVLGGADLASTLRTELGWTEAELTAAWRARLTALAGAPH